MPIGRASHIFNLLDGARRYLGHERQAYIGRVRTLAKAAGADAIGSRQRAALWSEDAALYERKSRR